MTLTITYLNAWRPPNWNDLQNLAAQPPVEPESMTRNREAQGRKDSTAGAGAHTYTSTPPLQPYDNDYETAMT